MEDSTTTSCPGINMYTYKINFQITYAHEKKTKIKKKLEEEKKKGNY